MKTTARMSAAVVLGFGMGFKEVPAPKPDGSEKRASQLREHAFGNRAHGDKVF